VSGSVAPAELGRWNLLASAVAGRLVDVAPCEAGEQTWTDGARIFVTAEASEREQLESVTVQAALLAAGSLHPDLVGALMRRPHVARRYLAVEGHRALAAHDALPPAARSLVDPRVAARTDSPAASLAVATSRDPVDEPLASFGTIRPRQLRRAIETTERSARSDKPPRDDTRSQELDDGDGDERADMSRFASPVGGGGPIGRLLKRMFRDARSPDTGPPGNDVVTHVTRQKGRGGGDIALTTARARRSEHIDVPERRVMTYPEWDVHRRRYRLDWCTVLEADGTTRERADRLVVPDTHALRRALARIGVGLERRRRQLQGDDVDVDAAVEAYVEAAAGSAPDEAVYVDTVRRGRDVAVLVLLDISGSTGEPSATGVPVHEHQRAAAAALVSALHDLGDRVALYAFRSHGRPAVNVARVKRFEDAFDARVLHRLGALGPGAYTRLGAAIRHGASVLEAEGGASRSLLVVLSDGLAYDQGYEGAYAESDARRALIEARRRGVGCLCLSIGAGTDADALRRVFGTAAHATLPRGEHLAGFVGPLFRDALLSAEHQQRAWQRTERTRERLQVERVSA
jgi:hypothetical protein